jgi:hypothetical protein
MVTAEQAQWSPKRRLCGLRLFGWWVVVSMFGPQAFAVIYDLIISLLVDQYSWLRPATNGVAVMNLTLVFLGIIQSVLLKDIVKYAWSYPFLHGAGVILSVIMMFGFLSIPSTWGVNPIVSTLQTLIGVNAMNVVAYWVIPGSIVSFGYGLCSSLIFFPNSRRVIAWFFGQYISYFSIVAITLMILHLSTNVFMMRSVRFLVFVPYSIISGGILILIVRSMRDRSEQQVLLKSSDHDEEDTHGSMLSLQERMDEQ